MSLITLRVRGDYMKAVWYGFGISISITVLHFADDPASYLSLWPNHAYVVVSIVQTMVLTMLGFDLGARSTSHLHLAVHFAISFPPRPATDVNLALFVAFCFALFHSYLIPSGSVLLSKPSKSLPL